MFHLRGVQESQGQVSVKALNSGTAERMFMQNRVAGLCISFLMSIDF